MIKGRRKECLSLALLIFPLGLLAACAHIPSEPLTATPERYAQVFDASEKVIFKALTRVLKDRGFNEPRVDMEKNRLETDYVYEGAWRTKIVADVKKIGRRDREVTLEAITEQKVSSPSGWKAKKILGKEQYEKLFAEIEMQIYREWYKGE